MVDLLPRTQAAPTQRSSAALAPGKAHRYWWVLGLLTVLAVAAAVGLLTWDNPVPPGTRGFWIIVGLRAKKVLVIALVTFAHAIATVSFQTVTNNRILTPSIMGFESLYVVVQTGAVFFLGASGVVAISGVSQFLLQIALMVGLAVLLYGWLLTGQRASLHAMLLIGIIIGGGLGAVATFMQRLLTPSEFDVLTARLFGSVANADADYLPVAIPLVAVAGALLWQRSRRLNVLALGPQTATNLGLNHRRELIAVLVLVAVLIATSTALVGPMTFLGFLVATLSYQLAGTHDHRYIFPIAALSGFALMAGAYFVMTHLFYSQGVVSILIELVGGLTFLVVILRKGRL